MLSRGRSIHGDPFILNVNSRRLPPAGKVLHAPVRAAEFRHVTMKHGDGPEEFKRRNLLHTLSEALINRFFVGGWERDGALRAARGRLNQVQFQSGKGKVCFGSLPVLSDLLRSI